MITCPTLAQVSKQGFTYVFERATGKPVWPTQPFPTKPPPFARQGLTADDQKGRAADAERSGRRKLGRRRLRSRNGLPVPAVLDMAQAKADFSLSATELFMYAFDKKSGALVWEYRMQEPPFGTPGRLVAFALPDRKRGE